MSSNAESEDNKKPIPAWKLRQQMLQQAAPPKPSQLNKPKAKQKTGFDAPLPPAFKTVRLQRLAFAKQQDRRKNNDTWVSLNSSHPDNSGSKHNQRQSQTEGGTTTNSTTEDYSSDDNDDDSFG